MKKLPLKMSESPTINQSTSSPLAIVFARVGHPPPPPPPMEFFCSRGLAARRTASELGFRWPSRGEAAPPVANTDPGLPSRPMARS
jgi:hypothetical protein